MPRTTSSMPKAPAATLPRHAIRLLEAMAEPGVAAIPDPIREGHVTVRATRQGVSLGGGSLKRASLEALLRRDLATPTAANGAAISAAGRAWLSRDRSRRDGAATEAFVCQHRTIETVALPGETGSQDLVVNTRESPLAWLHRRRGQDGGPLIDAAQFEAGERLRRDLTFAGMLPSVTARWDGAIGSGAGAQRDPAGATDAVIAARQRVRAALLCVGPDFADLLIDLCGFLKGVETIERERRWPPRSAKIVIRLALDHLARHYGLAGEVRGRSASAGIRSWSAEMTTA